MNLEERFFNVMSNYSNNFVLQGEFWIEIKQCYEHKRRKYHNLDHLSSMFEELEQCKSMIIDWDSIVFSTFYHDIIHSPLKKNNEDQSAFFAQKRLEMLGVKREKVSKVKAQIISTKFHDYNSYSDTHYFLDADLSILGKTWEEYLDYSQKIRKEYSIYPWFIFNTGRRKILKSMLNNPNLFKTEFFKEKYESQAKENIEKELILLSE